MLHYVLYDWQFLQVALSLYPISILLPTQKTPPSSLYPTFVYFSLSCYPVQLLSEKNLPQPRPDLKIDRVRGFFKLRQHQLNVQNKTDGTALVPVRLHTCQSHPEFSSAWIPNMHQLSKSSSTTENVLRVYPSWKPWKNMDWVDWTEIACRERESSLPRLSPAYLLLQSTLKKCYAIGSNVGSCLDACSNSTAWSIAVYSLSPTRYNGDVHAQPNPLMVKQREREQRASAYSIYRFWPWWDCSIPYLSKRNFLPSGRCACKLHLTRRLRKNEQRVDWKKMNRWIE
jgi:hypothetical protein